MKRFVKLVAAAVLLAAGTTATAMAQDKGSFFKRPVFVLQPSMIGTNVISAPDGVDSQWDFLARFTTVVPTRSPRFSLVFLTQWTPFAKAEGSETEINVPVFVWGGIIPFVTPDMTGGWLTMSIDPLGVFAPNNFADCQDESGTARDACEEDEGLYKHFFFLELATVFNVGQMMMKDSPTWSGFGIHLLVDQQITGLLEDVAGEKDRFNPVIIIGASLPIGR